MGDYLVWQISVLLSRLIELEERIAALEAALHNAPASPDA